MFAVGTLMWYLITVGAVVWMFTAVALSRYAMATVCVILYALFFHFLSKVSLLEWVSISPGRVLLIVVGYVIIGVIWSVPRWWLHVRKWSRTRQRYPKFDGQTVSWEMTLAEYRTQWIEKHHKNYWEEEIRRIMPTPTENIGKIATWILYWPVSMVVSVFEDLMREVIRWTVIKLKGVYDEVSHRALRSL